MPRASPCLRPIWTAFTLVIRILHQSRSRALRLSLLQVASVEGRRSNSTKTCATCCIPPVLPLIFVVRQPCCLIGRLHSHLSFRAVNPKGCSPRRTLLLPARVFRSRKTLARRDHAAAPKPHRLIVHMVPACGPVSYSDEYPKQKPKRRLKKQRKKRNSYLIDFLPFQNIHLHTHFHTPVYISYINSEQSHLCILLVSRDAQGVYFTCHLLLLLQALVYLFGFTFGVFYYYYYQLAFYNSTAA